MTTGSGMMKAKNLTVNTSGRSSAPIRSDRGGGIVTVEGGSMIYQSFSGDADAGNSRFTMNGGSLTNKQGHLFHVTNTNAVITLNSVNLVNEDPEKVLLSVCAAVYRDPSRIKANGHRLFVAKLK